ncbi:PH (Pleckstrin Homology) domain-containing protein [Chitinophaga skermanii]|uniref:PH (Pleckstrin Homology) domain-containing protein n=1 Tax=Chitinophaga skermanii TaxID=331697 RepID=A0A327QZH5_9BACT|nr:PH domain-containing protein [Chitinophaga skermanii]RAJ08843.1 PH (Pleckstrin Homology) domain-containing protein [Chitinophaga skermanii]
MRFETKLDTFGKITSGCIVLLTLGLLYTGFVDPAKPVYVGGAILLVVVLISLGLSPRSYSIEEGQLIIHRLVGQKRIPLASITAARHLDRSELGIVMRTMGIGGLFGYIGSFHSSKIGHYSSWTTNRDSLVLIETADKKYMISPTDYDGFLRAFQQAK